MLRRGVRLVSVGGVATLLRKLVSQVSDFLPSGENGFSLAACSRRSHTAELPGM